MHRLRLNITRTLIYIFLFFMLLIVVVPIWLVLVNGTRSTVEIQEGISLMPSAHLVANYNILIGRGMDLVQGFSNSTFIAVSSTVIGVYFAFLTAYALVVYDFKGKKLFENFIIVLVLIPAQLSIIGFYQYMSKLGLVDSYIPLILPNIAVATSVFFAKQYLESTVVRELIDAARIDGCSELAVFHRIMMPIAIPGAATLGIFAFVASWNNFFNAFILISSRDKYTLPMLVQTLRGDVYRTEYGAIYLGLAIVIAPILIVYAIFARYIVSGIAMGAVKE